jgi:hypothetical protein
MSGVLCVCNTSYYLYKNTCVTLCPAGYSTDTVAAECILNVLNCATPATLSTCSVCNGGYFLNVLDNLCYSPCPEGLETIGTNCQPYYYALNPTCKELYSPQITIFIFYILVAYEMKEAFARPWFGNSELSYSGISITQCIVAGICD